MPAGRVSRSALTLAGFACALLVAACGGGGGGGGSSSDTSPPIPEPLPDPQFRVSSLSPFAAGCDGVPASGTLYLNSEVEPFVAANPANAANLIGVWQQDRWSNGGAQGKPERSLVRRRPHVVHLDGRVLALHRRHAGQRR